MANYKTLIVFQKADELAFGLYKATESFPKSEIFGATSQLRRAALSIPTNIAEGYARKSKKELLQFVNIAMGLTRKQSISSASRSKNSTKVSKIKSSVV